MIETIKKGIGIMLAAVFATGSCIPTYVSSAGTGNTGIVVAEDAADTTAANTLTVGNPAEGHTYKVY